MKVERKPEAPVLRRRVPSKSSDGYHIVELYEDGHFECDCAGFMYHDVECRHIKAVKRSLTPNDDQ